MANYLYNGVELPDINTVWTDKTTYPYAVIARANSGAYQFRVSTEPFYYEARTAGTSVLEEVGSTGTQLIASMANGAWGELGPSYGADTVLLYSTPFVWANHDVVYKDSTEVYQEASEPVLVVEPEEPDEPVEPEEPETWVFDLHSFKVGLSLGLSGKPLPLANKEPIAYLYNGVQLPDINEVWTDKETNQFASIFYYEPQESYCVVFDGDRRSVSENGFVTFVYSKFYRFTDGVWKFVGASVVGGHLIWANYDVYHYESAGGGLYLATSEPIPVYE